MPLNKAPTTATAFSGLGFDLTGAVLAARGMRLSRFCEESGFAPRPAAQCVPWGFDLMLFLGRETGGS